MYEVEEGQQEITPLRPLPAASLAVAGLIGA
jgi:hypothetical protein